MANIIDFTDKYPLVHITKKIGGEKVTIRTYLSAEDYLSAVRTIADTCFEDGNYIPEYQEFAWRYVVLKYFTDIEIGDTSIEEIFKVTQSEWYETVAATCATYSYWNDVKAAAKELIDYRIATRKTAFDNLCDSLSAIMSADTEKNLADVKEILNKIDNIDPKKFVEAVVDKK